MEEYSSEMSKSESDTLKYTDPSSGDDRSNSELRSGKKLVGNQTKSKRIRRKKKKTSPNALKIEKCTSSQSTEEINKSDSDTRKKATPSNGDDKPKRKLKKSKKIEQVEEMSQKKRKPKSKKTSTPKSPQEVTSGDSLSDMETSTATLVNSPLRDDRQEKEEIIKSNKKVERKSRMKSQHGKELQIEENIPVNTKSANIIIQERKRRETCNFFTSTKKILSKIQHQTIDTVESTDNEIFNGDGDSETLVKSSSPSDGSVDSTSDKESQEEEEEVIKNTKKIEKTPGKSPFQRVDTPVPETEEDIPTESKIMSTGEKKRRETFVRFSSVKKQSNKSQNRTLTPIESVDREISSEDDEEAVLPMNNTTRRNGNEPSRSFVNIKDRRSRLQNRVPTQFVPENIPSLNEEVRKNNNETSRSSVNIKDRRSRLQNRVPTQFEPGSSSGSNETVMKNNNETSRSFANIKDRRSRLQNRVPTQFEPGSSSGSNETVTKNSETSRSFANIKDRRSKIRNRVPTQFERGSSPNEDQISEEEAQISENEVQQSENEVQISKKEAQKSKDEAQISEDEPEISEDEAPISEDDESITPTNITLQHTSEKKKPNKNNKVSPGIKHNISIVSLISDESLENITIEAIAIEPGSDFSKTMPFATSTERKKKRRVSNSGSQNGSSDGKKSRSDDSDQSSQKSVLNETFTSEDPLKAALKEFRFNKAEDTWTDGKNHRFSGNDFSTAEDERRETYNLERSVIDVGTLKNLQENVSTAQPKRSSIGQRISKIKAKRSPSPKLSTTLKAKGKLKKSRLSKEFVHGVVSNLTNSVKKNVTFNDSLSSHNLSKIKRTKMPNFSKIHQRQLERTESLTEYVQRTQERAQALLSGGKQRAAPKVSTPGSSKQDKMSRKHLDFKTDAEEAQPDKKPETDKKLKRMNAVDLMTFESPNKTIIPSVTPQKKRVTYSTPAKDKLPSKSPKVFAKTPGSRKYFSEIPDTDSPNVKVPSKSPKVLTKTPNKILLVKTPKKDTPKIGLVTKVGNETPGVSRKKSPNVSKTPKSGGKVLVKSPKSPVTKVVPLKLFKSTSQPSTSSDSPKNLPVSVVTAHSKSPKKLPVSVVAPQTSQLQKVIAKTNNKPSTSSTVVRKVIKTNTKGPQKIINNNKENKGGQSPNKKLKSRPDKEALKVAANKSRVPKVEDIGEKRGVLMGVRSNRRFDLLMKLRNKK